jgi:hypothetical protein
VAATMLLPGNGDTTGGTSVKYGVRMVESANCGGTSQEFVIEDGLLPGDISQHPTIRSINETLAQLQEQSQTCEEGSSTASGVTCLQAGAFIALLHNFNWCGHYDLLRLQDSLGTWSSIPWGRVTQNKCRCFHISIPSSKRVVRRFIDAVNSCAALDMKLPAHDELEELVAATTAKSSCDGCFHGCVLMIDGFLSPRQKPSDDEVTNPADYYSGHKRTHGLNVQAFV